MIDFIAECIIPDEPTEQEKVEPHVLNDEGPSKANGDSWATHVDGSSNSAGSEAGLILMNLEEMIAEYTLHFEFLTTNNEVEYQALTVGL